MGSIVIQRSARYLCERYKTAWRRWQTADYQVTSHVCSSQVRPSSVFACIGALGAPSRTGPSLESIYRVSLTVDLCEGNKIISFKKIFHHSQLGPLKEKKNPGALCPVCPLVKMALVRPIAAGVAA